MHTVTIEVDEIPATFVLDLETGTWSRTGEEIDESEFPLITWVDDKRYELYSDGRLSQEDLAGDEEPAQESPAT